jgi:putative thioredoxin
MEGTKTEGYEVTDFQRDVIESSREKPVLVDFWAAWCGPCRALTPVLEKLAQEFEEVWSFIKVNTDQNPEISAQYGIRGIPAVKLFVDGEVADEFTGVLPEHAIRQWLEKAIPSEAKKRIEEAERAIDGGELERGRELLETALVDEPDNPKARILLARGIVFDDPMRAAELASSAAFAGPGYQQTADAIKEFAAASARAGETDGLPDESGRDAYLAALRATAEADFDRAIEGLIEVLKSNRYYLDDAARKLGVAIFTLLGPDHDVTRRHRRNFDMWLY